MNKRHFIKSLLSIPLAATMGLNSSDSFAQKENKSKEHSLKISLNAYSFNGHTGSGRVFLGTSGRMDGQGHAGMC